MKTTQKTALLRGADGTNYLIPFILVTSLFFFWGVANNMTDTLLAAFKNILVMTDFQTSFIQMAFYGSYACFALPAAFLIRKYSFKTGIIVGLALYSLGTFCFSQLDKRDLTHFICLQFIFWREDVQFSRQLQTHIFYRWGVQKVQHYV